MVMRIGGLASGMDIDALVEKLMQAERSPLNKLQQKKQTYEWQRDAYRSVNTKLKTFDTYIADNLVLKTLNSKTANVSNSNYVTATATGSATGTLSIEGVSQLATSARGVGSQINATKDTKLSDLGITANSIQLKSIQSDGTLATKSTKIEFDPNTTTVGQFISKLNSSNAGVSAIFENGRLSITAQRTGDVKGGAEVVATSGNQVFEKLGFADSTNLATGGSNAVFKVNGIATERTTNTFSVNGYNITLKETFNQNATNVGSYNAARTEYLNASNQELFANLNIAKNNAEDAYNSAKSILEQERVAVFGSANPDVESNPLFENYSKFDLGFLSGLTEEQITKLKQLPSPDDANYDASLAELNEDSASESDKALWTKLNSLSNEQKNVLNSTDEETLKNFVNVANLEIDYLAKSQLKDNANTALSNAENRKADAEMNLNQAYKTYLNDPTAEVSLTNPPILSANVGEISPVTISSTTNVDDMMTKIKEFVNTYNGFIKDLKDQTKQTKYRDYTPLTAEQRKDMDEDEIKLWEEKAKSGLLRNDSIITTGLSNMRSLLYQSNPAIEDKRYNTLYSIGITTSSSYNDGGTLEIDETKLRKAIEENPDAVEQLFKNTGSKEEVINGQKVDTRGYLIKLRESMKSLEIKIDKKAGRSTMTDQQYVIGKNLVDTTNRIDTWEKKLKSIEERYWKQFNAMESAINKANQQSSMFMSGQ